MAQHNKLSRRRFLALGCGALCSAALAGGCASSLGTEVANASCPYGEVNDPYPGKCHRYVDQSGSGICDYSEVQDATSSSLAQSADADDKENDTAGSLVQHRPARSGSMGHRGQADDTVSSLEQRRSTTRCPKGLANDPYPGRCHHYIDRDGSGYCDLSETA
jgi:hypothetical protein